MSSPKLRVIFRPKSEIQTFFFAQIQVVSKKKKRKKKKVFTKIESDFSAEIGNSKVFSPKFRWSPIKKKKKGLHQNWDWFFAGLVTFRSVGGDASRNGAELFETEADFSAKIVTFRLVGGMHPSHPPPKSATGGGAIFNFSLKIDLKTTKKVRFCILHKPMGGLEPPLPPPPLATLLLWLLHYVHR